MNPAAAARMEKNSSKTMTHTGPIPDEDGWAADASRLGPAAFVSLGGEDASLFEAGWGSGFPVSSNSGRRTGVAARRSTLVKGDTGWGTGWGTG